MADWCLLVIDNKSYLINRDLKVVEIRDFGTFPTEILKDKDFSVELFGFDGAKKQTFKNFNSRKIFKIIDLMPMSKIFKDKKIKPLNLSLFSDYNPKTTTHGLGFKDKEKALYTVKAIKNRDLKYQVNVIATMLGRAKKHPYKTKNMKDAIKVFSLWMKNYKKK